MSDLRRFHADHGAIFGEHAGREVVSRYRRPERTHRAVRNGAGVIEMPYDVLVVTGRARAEAVGTVTTNRPPDVDGRGCYALILDAGGRIESDCYAYDAGERLLVFAPAGTGPLLVDRLAAHQGTSVEEGTDRLSVFGVHGPRATEKIASVLARTGAPEEPLSFVRGSLGDIGVNVVRTDAPVGETGYEVVCATDDALDVLDTLVNRGMAAVPFGQQTWGALTLEAGTPLFEMELAGRLPAVIGLKNAFPRGRTGDSPPPNGHGRLVGLLLREIPGAGARLLLAGEAVGTVTRAADSPILGRPIAFGVVDNVDLDGGLTVDSGGPVNLARVEPLPFVEGSERSARLPAGPK